MVNLLDSNIRRLLAALVMVSLLSACTPAGPGSESTVVRSDLERETSPQVPEGALDDLAMGNRAFAFDLYQALREEEGNLFFSPYSISAALAMTYAGARSETEIQMARTLHFDMHSQDELHPAFNALDLALESQADQNEEIFTLSIANSLWGQEGFPFKQEYLDLLARHYGAGMRLVNYVEEDSREAARREINDWVSEETQGKIENLIPENILTAMTRLVLANAIYFKGEWEKPFLNGTQDAPFMLLDGTQTQVPTMSRRASTLYVEGEGYQAVSLEYKGGRAAMLVLLPDEGGYEAFEGILEAEKLEEILGGLQSQDVKLYLPKFQFESQFGLAEKLAAMGMPDAFSDRQADFTGMYEAEQVGANLFISHVIHKSFVAVDEIGTEAAAATGVVVGVESMPLEVRVERPFVFVIYDHETGTILFAGRVLDPRR